MSNGAPNKITLTSSDGVDIAVGRALYLCQSACTNMYLDRDVAERSVLIKNMLEDLGDSGEAIPIPNVSSFAVGSLYKADFHRSTLPF